MVVIQASQKLRKQWVREEVMKRYVERQESISYICFKLDLQPVPVAKAILTSLGYSRNELKKLFAYDSSQVDDHNLRKLCKNDMDFELVLKSKSLDTQVIDDKQETVSALKFEILTLQLLKKLGLSFETETDLKSVYESQKLYISEEIIQEPSTEINGSFEYVKLSIVSKAQAKTFKSPPRTSYSRRKSKENFQNTLPKPVSPKVLTLPGEREQLTQGATPDFVFTACSGPKLYVEDIADGVKQLLKVNWLDCKNFMGGVNGHLDKKVVQQAIKYHRIFGTGAVVFKFGYSTKFIYTCNKLAGKVVFLHFDSFLELLALSCPAATS